MLELTSETVLLVFVKQTKIGSHVPNPKAYQEGRLQKLLKISGSENLSEACDYDLIIIGEGSGGLAATKESAKYNKKVLMIQEIKNISKFSTQFLSQSKSCLENANKFPSCLEGMIWLSWWDFSRSVYALLAFQLVLLQRDTNFTVTDFYVNVLTIYSGHLLTI